MSAMERRLVWSTTTAFLYKEGDGWFSLVDATQWLGRAGWATLDFRQLLFSFSLEGKLCSFRPLTLRLLHVIANVATVQGNVSFGLWYSILLSPEVSRIEWQILSSDGTGKLQLLKSNFPLKSKDHMTHSKFTIQTKTLWILKMFYQDTSALCTLANPNRHSMCSLSGRNTLVMWRSIVQA